MFDGIALGGTRRIVTYVNLHAEAVVKTDFQLLFLKTNSISHCFHHNRQESAGDGHQGSDVNRTFATMSG